MKILFQTNNRPNQHLEQEWKKLVESGHEPVPFGYRQHTISVEGPSHYSLSRDVDHVVLTGLEGIDFSKDPTYFRSGVTLLEKHLDMSVVKEGSDVPYSTICYSRKGFSSLSIPSSDVFLNKAPGKHTFASILSICDTEFISDVFIKPVNDLKSFAGFILKKGFTLREFRPDFVKENIYRLVHLSINVLPIQEEVRCYVVDKKVVTLSRYMQGGVFNMQPVSELSEQQYASFAENIISNVYAPADNFTLDLCEVDGKIKVMEYNCLNSSGLYECDSKALFDSLESYYYSKR